MKQLNELCNVADGIKEETQEDLWNEVGKDFFSAISFKMHERLLNLFKSKFTITRKPSSRL